jgi:alkylhydroperoxidase family enzyme
MGLAIDIQRVGKTNGHMVAFTDSQLRAVWAAADRVPFEKRGVFVEWVVARLQLQRGFTDADLDDAVRAALTGLIHSAA